MKPLAPDTIFEGERLSKGNDGVVVFDAGETIFEVLCHRFGEQDTAHQLLGPVLLAEREGIKVGVFAGEKLFDWIHNIADPLIAGTPAIDAEAGLLVGHRLDPLPPWRVGSR